MRKICSIVIALVMALTVFAIPSFGIAFAGEEDEVAAEGVVTTESEAIDEDADGTVKAAALDDLEITPGEVTTTSIAFSWNDVDAVKYEYWKDEDAPTVAEGTSAQLTGLTPNTSYKIHVKAYDAEGNTVVKDATATTKTEAVEPTEPEAPTGLKATPGYAKISYSWSAVEGADGYAIARFHSEKADGNYRDNGTSRTFTWTNLPRPVSKTFYVRAYKNLPEGTTDEEAQALGAFKINPPGSGTSPQRYVLLSDYESVSATPLATEKMVRKKFSKGYYYSYYQLVNGKWIKRGTSYDMWMKIKNVKSKTKYLIALDIKRNNVIIYKGKAGNWKVYKHFVVATGKKGKGTTHKGFSKISKRKIKFHTLAEHSKVGKKYTCWYATRYYGGQFFHSVLYQYNSKKKLHDGDVGCDKSHGCVRMKLGDAKWLYKNCKKGTVVVSSRTWNKHCSYGVWDATWK
ncbi:MAG: L,D-transpeptidase family protein [Firmicutes bacterium]|nr:L,D-transpeptidase family protein [Bacillota bacterium]